MSTGLKANPLPVAPHWLRANTKGAVGVDREKRVINGYVVAQLGPFLEPEPRGEFDKTSLRQIHQLMRSGPAEGTKVRLGHPTLSDDGISKFMGRARNPRMDSILVDGVELDAVRADLHLASSAFENNPNGNLGEYILQRAEEDPNSFATSLVLMANEEWRLDTHKQRKKDDSGKELPPLWRPTAIHASDIVDSGAAVSSFLSADILAGLPDALVRQACEMLDAQFAGQTREVTKARLSAFIERYLSYRYGEDDSPPGHMTINEMREQEGLAPLKPIEAITTVDSLDLMLWLEEQEAA